jgi:hypothetical protein
MECVAFKNLKSEQKWTCGCESKNKVNIRDFEKAIKPIWKLIDICYLLRQDSTRGDAV